MHTRPRRFSIAAPRRPQTSDLVVTALGSANDTVRVWGDLNTGLATWTSAELYAAHQTLGLQPGSPQGRNFDVAAFLRRLPQAQPARTSAAGA